MGRFVVDWSSVAQLASASDCYFILKSIRRLEVRAFPEEIFFFFFAFLTLFAFLLNIHLFSDCYYCLAATGPCLSRSLYFLPGFHPCWGFGTRNVCFHDVAFHVISACLISMAHSDCRAWIRQCMVMLTSFFFTYLSVRRARGAKHRHGLCNLENIALFRCR